MTSIDSLYQLVSSRDERAFADWMGCVERPIRSSLRSFARAVDVEGIVQETLLRMWVLAPQLCLRLQGENASLRYALGIARNLAKSEAKRLKREVHLPQDEISEPGVFPAAPSDPGLAEAIRTCFEKLARRPRQALEMRIGQASLPDRELSRLLGMTLNTFRQNIVRARKQLADCLQRRGIPLEELYP